MNWEAVIGLEVHVQLATATKAFSGSASRFGDQPNTMTDPVVLGLPGALPTFNQAALEAAIRLGLACGCRIARQSQFARKQYFYPDLPKGYQISQFEKPLCLGGAIEFRLGDRNHSVALTRIHLEEDAGKSSHRGGSSFVDLNRAGIPLCEIVSEPVLSSAAEAAQYLRALRQLVRYLGVSLGNMEQGHLRCDANVSVRPRGQCELGIRTELKNINSFRFVENAIDHEILRQIEILEDGGTVHLETRLWDAELGRSASMRSKEEAADYRYFPDPDLPPLIVSEAMIEEAMTKLPELPEPRRRRFESDYGLSRADAELLTADRGLADYFEAATLAAGGGKHAKATANWISSELLRELSKEGIAIEDSPVAAARLGGLIELIVNGTISGKIAKNVFAQMIVSPDSAIDIVNREGWIQITDEASIAALVDNVLAANPSQRAAYRAGKKKLLGFFVGQVMKASFGKANPAMVNTLLTARLDEGS